MIVIGTLKTSLKTKIQPEHWFEVSGEYDCIHNSLYTPDNALIKRNVINLIGVDDGER